MSKWKRRWNNGELRSRIIFALMPRYEVIELDGETFRRRLWLRRVLVREQRINTRHACWWWELSCEPVEG